MRRATTKAPERATSPKDIARSLAERGAMDHSKLKRESRRAVDAADRLLREMDEVLKNLDRKS